MTENEKVRREKHLKRDRREKRSGHALYTGTQKCFSLSGQRYIWSKININATSATVCHVSKVNTVKRHAIIIIVA